MKAGRLSSSARLVWVMASAGRAYLFDFDVPQESALYADKLDND